MAGVGDQIDAVAEVNGPGDGAGIVDGDAQTLNGEDRRRRAAVRESDGAVDNEKVTDDQPGVDDRAVAVEQTERLVAFGDDRTGVDEPVRPAEVDDRADRCPDLAAVGKSVVAVPEIDFADD